MEFTYEQNLVITETNHMAVVGGPGTGKSSTLVEKAAYLVENKSMAGRVFVSTFNWRSHLMVKAALQKRLGEKASGVVCGTFRDFAQVAIEQSTGQRLNIANFATIHRTLRAAMDEVGFAGTALEAEHIIRKFKGAANKPKGDEPFFKLFETYKNIMESNGWMDRHDIVRQHILGMRKGKYKPCPASHLLVNNLQDATHVQMLWVKEHIKNGTTVAAFGNENQTLFARDGGLGEESFNLLEDVEGIVQYDLMENFRTPSNLHTVVETAIKPAKGERTETYKTNNTTSGFIRFLPFNSLQDELKALVDDIPRIVKSDGRLAILVYNDAQAHYVERALQKALVPHACFAESVWLTSGARLVMDLLYLMLGEGGQNELANVLIGFGFHHQEVVTLMHSGLKAETWLDESQGGPLPDELRLRLNAVRTRMTAYLESMQSGGATARDAFKAAAADILENTSQEDREAALLAIEGLVSLKGRLMDLLPQLKKRRDPDLNAQVVVAPVKEARNMEFGHVYMPFMGLKVWPWGGYKQIGHDVVNDRRRLYMALSRSSKNITLSYTGSPSLFLEEIKATWEGNAEQSAA